MSFFAVLLALLIEQWRSPTHVGAVQHAAQRWMDGARRNLDAGGRGHAWLVWLAAVVLPAAVVAFVHVLLRRWSTVAALAFDVAVLHVSLGFRHFSHHVTNIRDALDRADWDDARRELAAWRGVDATEWPRSDLVRQIIEHALIDAHRHVFGVFFCFVVLGALGCGPMGAVLYRLASRARYALSPTEDVRTPFTVAASGDVSSVTAAAAWGGPATAAAPSRASSLAQHLFLRIDHVPARLTAFGFAVVGNFEDAIEAWRREAAAGAGRWRNEALILTAAGGALGLRLGPLALPSSEAAAPAGQAPSPAHLRAVVALVWRSVVLWMVLLALLSLANLVG